MRAVVLREFGSPSRLEIADLPEPELQADETAIDVQVAGVAFVDTQIRAGRPPSPAMAPALPAVLGNSVGGVSKGRRVVSSLRGTGGYAERAVASATAPIEVPDALALGDAVALVADGRTALLVVRSAALRAGETALILAAGGGVGSLLVQLARLAQAHVVAAASGQRKLDLALSLGADHAIDYLGDGWAAELGPVDVVFDGVGGAIGRAAFERLRPGGRLVRVGMASGAFTDASEDEAAALGVTLAGGARPSPHELRELSREALDLGADGQLRPTVGQTFPLERAADAHAAMEARATLGKTLLEVAAA